MDQPGKVANPARGWCPCTVINVSVQYNGGGLLPDIILYCLLTRCGYIVVTLGTPFDTMKRFCLYSQSMFPPKPLDNFPPEGGCSEGLDAFRFVFTTLSV